MTIEYGKEYYLRDGTKVSVVRHVYAKIYSVNTEDEVSSDFLFSEPPGYAYDAYVRKIYIGSRFYANGKIWQVTGFKNDGRIRAQEFLLGIDVTHLIGSRGAPVDRIIGPTYLFRGEQINQRHGEAPSTFDADA